MTLRSAEVPVSWRFTTPSAAANVTAPRVKRSFAKKSLLSVAYLAERGDSNPR